MCKTKTNAFQRSEGFKKRLKDIASAGELLESEIEEGSNNIIIVTIGEVLDDANNLNARLTTNIAQHF